jgi:lactosylceramide 4-alpha-galactosyltransferase
MFFFLIRDLLINFNGNDWGNNGPGVITRILHKVCQTTVPDQMDRARCHSFKVFPIEAFYAIRWPDFRYFFEEKYLNETMAAINQSIVVHVWNKHSRKLSVKVGSNVAYGLLAEEYCPKVYRASGEFF